MKVETFADSSSSVAPLEHLLCLLLLVVPAVASHRPREPSKGR